MIPFPPCPPSMDLACHNLQNFLRFPHTQNDSGLYRMTETKDMSQNHAAVKSGKSSTVCSCTRSAQSSRHILHYLFWVDGYSCQLHYKIILSNRRPTQRGTVRIPFESSSSITGGSHPPSLLPDPSAIEGARWFESSLRMPVVMRLPSFSPPNSSSEPTCSTPIITSLPAPGATPTSRLRSGLFVNSRSALVSMKRSALKKPERLYMNMTTNVATEGRLLSSPKLVLKRTALSGMTTIEYITGYLNRQCRLD